MTSPAKQLQTSTTVTHDVITDTYSATRVSILYIHLEYYISIKQELKTITLYKVICGHVISHIITIHMNHMMATWLYTQLVNGGHIIHPHKYKAQGSSIKCKRYINSA